MQSIPLSAKPLSNPFLCCNRGKEKGKKYWKICWPTLWLSLYFTIISSCLAWFYPKRYLSFRPGSMWKKIHSKIMLYIINVGTISSSCFCFSVGVRVHLLEHGKVEVLVGEEHSAEHHAQADSQHEAHQCAWEKKGGGNKLRESWTHFQHSSEF